MLPHTCLIGAKSDEREDHAAIVVTRVIMLSELQSWLRSNPRVGTLWHLLLNTRAVMKRDTTLTHDTTSTPSGYIYHLRL